MRAGLNTWQSRGGSAPPPGTTGLFHAAFLYPTRPALARAVARVIDAQVPLTGASDHGVSEAIHLDDPDGNGIELYRDRPRDQCRGPPAGTSRCSPRRWICESCSPRPEARRRDQGGGAAGPARVMHAGPGARGTAYA